jgi:transcriptional regulator GlxA family with amidase domain
MTWHGKRLLHVGSEAQRYAGALSARSLSRRVRAVTGLSTRRFIQKIRLNSALHLIEQTRLPMDRVAERVGFADAAVLHRLVVRHTGQSPGRFRKKKIVGERPERAGAA